MRCSRNLVEEQSALSTERNGSTPNSGDTEASYTYPTRVRRKQVAVNGFRVMDSDMHVQEPADLWAKRIEPEYRHRIPRQEVDDDGVKVLTEGRPQHDGLREVGRARQRQRNAVR